MLKELYYCSECKKIIEEIEDLYFVEDGTPRGFCSESCIEKFYADIVKHFEKLINDKKEELKLDENSLAKYHEDPHLIDQLLKDPTEIRRIENQLKEEYFVFFKNVKDSDVWLVATCFVFNYRPSFILSLDATKSEDLLKFYRQGEKVEDMEPFKQSESENVMEQEVLEEIEQKKSKLLADLLTMRKDTDIPFESFPLYEDFFDVTLHDPDEMYSHEDEEGDEIVVCIKAHDKDGVSFYYFVLCIHVGDKVENVDSNAIFPVLGFPSLDGNIYKNFQVGRKISGQLKN